MRLESGYDWLASYPDKFSLTVASSAGERVVGASTPVVIASVQKMFTLEAVSAIASRDQSFLDDEVPVRELDRYFCPGTDAGAHERSLLAFGLRPSMLEARLSVRRLLVAMMFYSSNAAADALEVRVRDMLGAEHQDLRGRRPRLFLEQNNAERRGDAHPWYTCPTARVVESLRNVAIGASDSFDALSVVPRLEEPPSTGARIKRGRLPGYRAGAIVTAPGARRCFGAFTFETTKLDAMQQDLIEKALVRLVLDENINGEAELL